MSPTAWSKIFSGSSKLVIKEFTFEATTLANLLTRFIDKQEVEEEDRKAKEEIDRLEHARKKNEEEGAAMQNDWGYKNKSPYGQWVEYVDKRDNSIFYYNRVSRQSQKDKPKDFIKDKKRVIKESTFGHAFYHWAAYQQIDTYCK